MHKSRWLIWVRALIDVVALVAAVLLAYNYRFHVDRIPIPGTEPRAFGYYLAAAPLLGLIFVVTFAFIGAAALAGLVTLALMSIYRGFSYSRLVLIYTVVIALVLITAARTALRQVLIAQQRRGIGTDRVLVVGTGVGSEQLLHRMT